MEQTLVLLKPDAVQRGLVGSILVRLEQRGLKMVGLKIMVADRGLANRHYEQHQSKPFFKGLVEFITSGPIIAVVFEGRRAVDVVRESMGATGPAEALPGTIRGDFGLDIGRNLIHGSDSLESANREIPIFFKASELVGYSRDLDPWVIEPSTE